jgi:hypothetical protein
VPVIAKPWPLPAPKTISPMRLDPGVVAPPLRRTYPQGEPGGANRAYGHLESNPPRDTVDRLTQKYLHPNV